MEDVTTWGQLASEDTQRLYEDFVSQSRLGGMGSVGGVPVPSGEALPTPPGYLTVPAVLHVARERSMQVEEQLDELLRRLSAAGVLQDLPHAQPMVSDLPPATCPLVSALLHHAEHLERLRLQLCDLLHQLVL